MTSQPTFWEQPGKRLTPGEKFARWIGTVQGRELYRIVEHRALAQANSGAKRVELNQIWADVRKDHKVKLDNSMRAPCADALIAAHPWLDTKIERRRRKAATA